MVIKTLFGKLMALQLLAAMLMMSIVCVFINRWLSREINAIFETRGRFVAQALANSVEPSLVSHDLTSAEAATDAILATPDVEWAYVTSPDHRILAHTFIPKFPEALRESDADHHDAAFTITMPGAEAPTTVFTQPVLEGIVGEAHVGFTRKHLISSIHRTELLVLVTTLGVMLVVTPALLVFTNRLVKPIRALTLAAQRVGQGDESAFQLLPLRTQDEIAELTSAFSSMGSQIRANKRILEEANAKLTKEIVQRRVVQEHLEKAKQAAEIASRVKSEFLANVSHEIRTPMNGIIGMTELALDTDLTSEARGYLETVRASSDAMMKVIDDILDFSRIEGGKIVLETVEFNLRENVDATLRTLAARVHQKGLELIGEVLPKVPDVILGDPGRLRQIIVNLVGNAIKFTERGEIGLRVVLESRNERGAVLRFAVSDTGIGIPRDKQEMIFKRFTQVDSSMTRRYGGTGLGLAISSQLVGLMGGRIWVDSEIGQGSTFYFTIQVAVPAPSKESSQRIASAAPTILQGLRVLVVDDNRTNRSVLEGTLKRWGMKPTLAEDGLTALTCLMESKGAERPYPLVLVDAQMPEMDGFTLAGRIKREIGLAGPTIMMLSSAGQRGDAARCRELGISAYLTKPIQQLDLREAILTVLGAKAGNSEPPPLTTTHSLRETRPALSIIVAEDNRVNQQLIKRLLEKRGHRVIVSENGREALNTLNTHNWTGIDLVLMDVQMPEMDGFEATAAIREHEKESSLHLPVIGLTAHAMKGDRERCLDAGMDDYMTKPVKPTDLFALIERLVPGAAAVRAVQDGQGHQHSDTKLRFA